MPDDDFNVFRIGILVFAVIGMVNSIWMVRRAPGPDITMGPVTMTKERWIKAILVWNAIGIPLFAAFLFLIWRM